MSTAMIEEEQSTTPRRPWGPRPGRIATAVLAALVLFGGGLGIGLTRDGTDSVTTTTALAAMSVATVPVSTAIVPSAATEPVAAVAAALSPSVVQLERTNGVGSGFIYDASGLILTAAHVVEGVDQVTVVLSDGTRVPGTVIGADAGFDVAVVKIEAPGLVAAPLALDSEVVVGQTAIALGSPFGLDGSVTSGVVSAIGRNIANSDGRVRTVIQTDAPINPGNSGGPLADRLGRVIGINDFIFSPSGGSAGVGFATPIGIAYEVAGRLAAGESIGTGFLGVGGTDPDSGSPGALITEVVSGSPADVGGILVGDLVIAVDGVETRSMADLAALIQQHEPGSMLGVTVVRDGARLQLSVTLGERPS